MSELRTGLSAPSGALPNFPPEGSLDALLAKASSSPMPSAPQTGPDTVMRSPSMRTTQAFAPNTPLIQVVNSGALDAFVDHRIALEGHSPAGVVNNPGNIKFSGLPGQVDSGVKATDGGTFASYESPQAGRAAIAELVRHAASGQSAAYGHNPTVASFDAVYGNTLHDAHGSMVDAARAAGEQAHTERQKLIDSEISALGELQKQIGALSPHSEERHRLVAQQLERSQKLQDSLLEMARNPPQQKPTDLMSTFGSLAMLVAAIGGSRSRQPATASLNAAAGVIEGVNSNNKEEFERNLAVWKAQTGALRDVLGFQNDTFREIMENERLDEAERREQITEAMRMFDMAHGIRAMEMGNVGDGYKIVTDLAKLEADLKLKEAETYKAFHQGLYGPGSRATPMVDEGRKDAKGNPTPYFVDAQANTFTINPETQEREPYTPIKPAKIGTDPSSGRARSAPAMFMQQYMQEHPEATSSDLAAAMAEYRRLGALETGFASGLLGRQIISLNTVADHILRVEQYAEALRNGQIPRANAIANRIAVELGKPEVTSFEAGRDIMADEVVRLLTSTGGTEADRQGMQRRLNTMFSPDQFAGVFGVFKEFTGARFKALRQQYAEGDLKREKEFDEHKLTPEGRQVFESITDHPKDTATSANIPSAAVDYLKAHPDLRDQFDAKYGAGSAAKVLGQ